MRKTEEFGLTFGKCDVNYNELYGFCDSDYAGDLQTRKSTSGFIFLLYGAPVSWSSKRQSCVALSTTEAEFIAAAEAAKEAIWLQRFMHELGFPKRATSIYCDNQGAIALIRNPVFHQRTKHMEVRLFFIREAQEEGKIDVSYVNTDNQLADIMTKALPVPRFQSLRENLSICEMIM